MDPERLDKIRKNDILIYELISREDFRVNRDGQVFNLKMSINDGKKLWILKNKKAEEYEYVNFKYKKLNLGRIVFAKYGDTRLVAEKVINHIDGNKTNNYFSNLELITNSENGIHASRILRKFKPKEPTTCGGLSGRLLSTNDDLIRKLLEDTNYRVTRDGKVLTKITKTGKISVDDIWREAGHAKAIDGYYSIGYEYKNLRRSRIVFAKFNGELAIDMVVNHIDGNTTNDSPANLELITQSENNIHRYRVLGNKPVIGHSKIDMKIATEIRKLAKSGWTNKSLREKFQVSKSTISYVVNGKIWK